MDILVLGGTQFVGRHIVESLLCGGHAVTVFNRGITRDELPAEAERLRGDRNLGRAGLAALGDRKWDTCVDVSGFTAVQVRASAELLCDRVGRYVYISAVSVYGDPPTGPVDEAYPRVPPAAENVTELDAETYGRLKVTCEDLIEAIYGERSTVLRPQMVAGAHDPFDRFSYWVRRASQGGQMLAPGDGSDYLQVIDASDVGQFARLVCERGLAGRFNLAGPRIKWMDFMRILDAANVVWVPQQVIAAAGVTEFELPLFRPNGGNRSSLMHICNARALAAGLTLSDTATTVAKVHDWLREHDGLIPAMSRERESLLIAAARSQSTAGGSL